MIVVVNVMSWSFTQFCENHGIQRQFTMTITPQQNVVFKVKESKVLENVKRLLNDNQVQLYLWL